MANNPKSKWKDKNWRGLFLYLEGKLYLSNHRYQDGYNAFMESLAIYNNAETAMAMTMEFSQADNHAMAYTFLQKVKDKYISDSLKQDVRLNLMFNDLDTKLKHDLGYQ